MSLLEKHVELSIPSLLWQCDACISELALGQTIVVRTLFCFSSTYSETNTIGALRAAANDKISGDPPGTASNVCKLSQKLVTLNEVTRNRIHTTYPF
jgi:hypothetical protein